MRGIYTPVTDIRRKVFTEVARMSYEGGEMADYAKDIRDLPYKIIPGEVGQLRSSIFLERAIVSERIRLAMGLSLRPLDESVPATENLEHSVVADKFYEPPLINVIKFACNQCPEKLIKVTAMCQGCLAHPCQEVCPKKAISFRNGKSHIDQDLCIKCGRCVSTCPYNAIVKVERPCAKACGMGAIHSDAYGRADIDYDKCVSCGMCLVNCPFGAIVDKGQIFQLIQAIKRGDRVIAIVAPAFINQFPGMTPSKLREAMKQLGFAGTAEVAVGADLCTIDEAHDFLEDVPEKHPFMGTSCCPAWSVMAKKNFPKFADCISMTMTPMVLTARLIKNSDPKARICFVGPCAAKKLEASRRTVRSEVDFVLTFEELMGMFEAKGVDFNSLPDDPNDNFDDASADGRGFAVSGGVAQAVVNAIKKIDPDREVKVVSAQGLAECKKMMQLAAAGKYNGYLLEGMACPGGCIAGAGTLADPGRSAMMLNKYKTQASMKSAVDTPYKDTLDRLKY
ncbi:4Fe-4S dicluster domain-containing protein [bacterium]|nr:4Fe-4S dicluster domain-containing protein [bacterium]